MSSIATFLGSKKRRRVHERDARRARALQRRLDRITDLCGSIRDEAHLRQILADCPDDAARLEIVKLLEPLLPFSIGGIQLVSAEGATPLLAEAARLRGAGAPLVVER